MKKPAISKFENIISTTQDAEQLAQTGNPFVWVSCGRECLPDLNRLCKKYGGIPMVRFIFGSQISAVRNRHQNGAIIYLTAIS